MPTSSVDWQAIKGKYEQGIRQASLAREHGITQQAISKRALKEGWQVQFVVSPTTIDNFPQPGDNQPDEVLSVIGTLLQKVIKHAQQEDIEIKDIKLLADALSQFHKIRLTSPDDKPSISGTPSGLLPYLNSEQLGLISELQGKIDEVLDVARAKKLEQENGIRSIHKRVS